MTFAFPGIVDCGSEQVLPHFQLITKSDASTLVDSVCSVRYINLSAENFALCVFRECICVNLGIHMHR